MQVYHGENYNIQMGHLALVNNRTNVSNQGLQVSPALATSTWAICSVWCLVASGVVLYYAAQDGTMRHYKAVPQCTPYRYCQCMG